MMKAMISQPMNGLTDKQIQKTRDEAILELKRLGYEVVDSYFNDEFAQANITNMSDVVHIPVCFLAKSIEMMSKCDVVYFCNGWENARGCKIEHEIATQYRINIMYERAAIN